MLSPLFSKLTIRRETWDRSEWVQAIAVGIVFLCSAGAVLNWYEWFMRRSPLHVAVLWTLPVVAVLAIVPKRRILIGAVLAVYVLYSLKAVYLNQEPRAWYLVGAAVVLLVLLLATTPADYK